MDRTSQGRLRRRDFVRTVVGGAAAGLAWQAAPLVAGQKPAQLEAGEGTVDITPPLGIEMAGFHRPPDNLRSIAGIRQPGAVRALALRHGDTQAAVVSIDMLTMDRMVSQRIRRRVEQQLGIPAAHVRLCATHSHSMPNLRFMLQWGTLSPEYTAVVEDRVFQAIKLAQADLAPAELLLGKSRAVGGNFNRVTKDYLTDEHFTKDSDDQPRWIDTMVHVLRFNRGTAKGDLLWYHFSSHPVCYYDDQAGPDWPGIVATRIQETYKLVPSYLQGHCGDVNPGDGTHWIGKPEPSANPVFDAIVRAMDSMKTVPVDAIHAEATDFAMPLDVERLKQWLEEYRANPDACSEGLWVDAGFAKAWFDAMAQADLTQTQVPAALGALRLGELGMVFHPTELYSCYGLITQRDSPFADTIVVGYADDYLGYAPDPRAYRDNEYSAMVVPKICALAPFTPTAARSMSAAMVELLKRVAG